MRGSGASAVRSVIRHAAHSMVITLMTTGVTSRGELPNLPNISPRTDLRSLSDLSDVTRWRLVRLNERWWWWSLFVTRVPVCFSLSPVDGPVVMAGDRSPMWSCHPMTRGPGDIALTTSRQITFIMTPLWPPIIPLLASLKPLISQPLLDLFL